MKANIPPGLYMVGRPDKTSPVLVTANYRLSFDHLRRELTEIDAWILVLDTRGINVWCAAGKGTFGTAELVDRIQATELSSWVDHRRVILPQLGAPGVQAHTVKQVTGFTVEYGPVRASDLPAYLAADRKATPRMRKIDFHFGDRFVLTPMELVPAMRKFPLFLIAVLVVFGLAPQGVLFKTALIRGGPFAVAGLVAVIAGTFLAPLLLPILPFRSFALKGAVLGLAASAALAFGIPSFWDGVLAQALMAVTVTSISSYLALMFTGSTTFTSISGVRKELRIAVPTYIVGAVALLVLLVLHKISIWGLS